MSVSTSGKDLRKQIMKGQRDDSPFGPDSEDLEEPEEPEGRRPQGSMFRAMRNSFSLSKELSQPKEQYYFSEKVDVYGVGMILYQMLSGSEPFKGISGPQIWFTVLGRRNQPQITKMQLPPLLEYILRMCLHHDPEKRLTLQNLSMLWHGFEQQTLADNTTAPSGSPEIKFDADRDSKLLEAVQALRELHGDYVDHSASKRGAAGPPTVTSLASAGTYDRSWEAMVPKGSICNSTYSASVAESIAESCEEDHGHLRHTTSGLSSYNDEDFSVHSSPLRPAPNPVSPQDIGSASARPPNINTKAKTYLVRKTHPFQKDETGDIRKSTFKQKLRKVMQTMKLFRVKTKPPNKDSGSHANLYASVHGYNPSAHRTEHHGLISTHNVNTGSLHGGSVHGSIHAQGPRDDMYTIWSSRSSPSVDHKSPHQVDLRQEKKSRFSLFKKMLR